MAATESSRKTFWKKAGNTKLPGRSDGNQDGQYKILLVDDGCLWSTCSNKSTLACAVVFSL